MLRSHLLQSAAFLTAGCLIASPWFSGGVSYAIQMWIVFCACAALTVYVGWPGKSTGERGLPPMAVPLLLAVLMGALQLIPLPRDRALRWFVATAEYWETLAGGVADRTDRVDSGRVVQSSERNRSIEDPDKPLSLYPWETRKRLASLGCGVAFFALGSYLFGNPARQMTLLVLISLNGCGVAISGLVQRVSWYTRSAGSDAIAYDRLFGPYINKNNGAGYLLLALSTAIGLCVWESERRAMTGGATLWRRWFLAFRADQVQGGSAHGLLPGSRYRPSVGWVCAALIATGIAASLSRSAVVAMVIAMIATVGLSTSQDRRRVLALVGGALVLGLALLVPLGNVHAVATRLSTLTSWSTFTDGSRVTHWMDAWCAGEAFALLGSGLGTYRFVYPLWESTVREEWFHHAENQFLETFVETGVVGLVLLFLAIGLFTRACWQLLHSRDAWHRTLGVIGCFMLTSQVVHGMSDFSLYLPANSITMAMLCGLIAGAARRTRTPSIGGARLGLRPWWSRRRFKQKMGPFERPILAFLAVGLLLGVGDLRDAEALTRAYRVSMFGARPLPSNHEETCQHIRVLTRAVDTQPLDARAQVDLAELWIHAYRQGVAIQAGGNPEKCELSRITAPMHLHAKAYQLKAQDVQALNVIQQDVLTRQYLVPAVYHFRRARETCPLLTLPHLRLAQLDLITAGVEREPLHLERLRRLCGMRSDLLRACGVLAWNAGHKQGACYFWRQAFTKSSQGLSAILNYVDQSTDLALYLEHIVPDAPAIGIQVVREYLQTERFVSLQRKMLDSVERRLGDSGLPKAEQYYLQGQIYQLRSSHQSAYQSYQIALQLRPRELEWRFELSTLLRDMGRLQLAYAQAQQCLREAPNVQRYRQRVESLQARILRRAPSPTATPQ